MAAAFMAEDFAIARALSVGSALVGSSDVGIRETRSSSAFVTAFESPDDGVFGLGISFG
jgi:hypothetical protein